MFGKKSGTISVVCINTLLLTSGLSCGCESEEIEQKKETVKKTSYSSQESDQQESQQSFFDLLLDRYPVLDKIIQMLLGFIYSWLGNINVSIG